MDNGQPPNELEIRNEFGTVVISVDHSANGPRLRLAGLNSGTVIHLDVLEIEALSGMSHEDFAVLIAAHVDRMSSQQHRVRRPDSQLAEGR